MEPNEIDLGDPEVFAHLDHHQIFARLRAEDPVHRTKSPFGGYWSVTRYEDVRGVYRDPATFSSERGGVICPSSLADAEMSREEQGCGGPSTVASCRARWRNSIRRRAAPWRKSSSRLARREPAISWQTSRRGCR